MDEASKRHKRPFTWGDSFSIYEARSNENECVATAFEKHVAPLFLRDKIHWIDAGCGDCLKTVLISKILCAHEVSVSRLTLVDPDLPKVLPLAQDRLGQLALACADVRLVTGCLADIRPSRDLVAQRTLLTALHSVHDADACRALIGTFEGFALREERLTVLVVSESEESDFYKVRSDLAEAGFEVPRPFTRILENAAKLAGAEVARFEIGSQYCKVDSDGDRAWLVPFLTGETAASFSRREPLVQHAISRICEKYIADLNRDHLLTPDEALLLEFT